MITSKKSMLTNQNRLAIGSIFLCMLNSISYADVGNANDLCYGDSTGGCKLFIVACETQYPINNLSNSNLTNTKIFVDTSGIATVMSACSIDKGTKNKDCKNKSNYTFGPVGIFTKGTEYNFKNIVTKNSKHTADQQAFIDMTHLNKIYASYEKDGVTYSGRIYKCGEESTTGSTSTQTGLFDAWDVSRDQVPTPPSDRNISTKIVKQTFKLSLASLDKTNTFYEPKVNSGGTGPVDVAVSIYPKNSSTPISNSVLFYPSVPHRHESADVNVTSASKDALVGFKFCATYEEASSSSTNGTIGKLFSLTGNSDTPTSDEPEYHFYNSNRCTSSSDQTIYNCDAHTAGNPTWHLCYSTDDLAIRPDHFVFSSTNSNFPEKLHAGHEYNLTVTAYDADMEATKDYNQTSDNINTTNHIKWLNTNPKKQNGDGATLPATTNPKFKDFNMSDGVSSVNGTKGEVAQLSYDDIGYVTQEVNDTKWADVDKDDTPANCNGMYICGDHNVTFIPDHFAITYLEVNNSINGKFTYLNDCNDSNNSTFKNMSARVSATIVAQNEKNGTTENFTTGDGFYEQELNVTFSISDATHGEANKTNIANTLLGFGTSGDDNGTKTIPSNETNLSKALRFNFHREVNKAINPFEINATNVTLELNTTYGDTTILGSKNSNTHLDGNATFVYGQAHAGTQRYQVPNDANYTANIYYEIYCYGTGCDISLITPFNPTLKHLDDIRWYKNMEHNVSIDGNVSAVFEKNMHEVKATDLVNSTTPSKINLKYNGTLGYPYTTTMEVNASKWLIYNQSNANATSNPFQVEFNKENTGWGGKHETNTSTTVKHTAKTNGRVMW